MYEPNNNQINKLKNVILKMCTSMLSFEYYVFIVSIHILLNSCS